MRILIEDEKIEMRRNMKYDPELGEIRLFGIRSLLTNPIPSCKQLDKMFGTGAEVIVHNMWFEQGYQLFDTMINNDPVKTEEELLKEVVETQPQAGWGKVALRVQRKDPPAIEIVVKNSPIKTVKGSQKHLIGSFWAGVLSRYFKKQLLCKNFSYDEERDEFFCVIST